MKTSMMARIATVGLLLGSPVWAAPPTTTTTKPPTTTTTTLPATRADADKDGVADAGDKCPATTAKDVVDQEGCGLGQLCPCTAPRTAGKWKSHGEYVKCVRKALLAFRRAKKLNAKMAGETFRSARRSHCGQAASKPVRAGRIRCCRSHAGVAAAPMCVAMTPKKCAAKRGRNLGAGSCTPNPCR